MSEGNTTAQQLAIKQTGNVLVVAGAGTGKTRTLVQRCVRLLLDTRCGLDRILMVTFTDAAAAEMRKRIREELRKLQRSEQDPAIAEYIRNQLLLLDAAHIGTLHSFCLQVVRRHTHQIEIDPNVVVLDESQAAPLRSEVLEGLLRRHYADEKAGEMHNLVRQIGGGIDARIRGLILRVHRHSQSLADPDEWLAEQERIYSTPEPTAWRKWLQTAFEEWRNEWLPDLQEFAHLPAIQLFTTASTADKALNALAGVRDSDEANGLKKLKRFWGDVDFLASVCNDGLLTEEWNNARSLVLTLLRLTREFNDRYASAKRQMGGVDFSDLEQHALRLLRNPSGITGVARQWRERFKFIFVDECQDINRAQDAIIQAISREGDEANRFLVGDVKQSIFRFRRADPSIFTEYDDKWARKDGGARIPLSDNFRSRQSILGFVNTLFSALMRSSVGGVNYGTDAHLQFGDSDGRQQFASAAEAGPRVELHLIEPPADEPNGGYDDDEAGDDGLLDLTKTEREARLAATLLQTLRDNKHLVWDEEEGRMRPVRWQDMAVLLRSAANRVESYAKEFSRAGVPLIAARSGFFDTFEVSDLLNLLRILDNPIQDVPLLAVLRSPFGAFTLEELSAIRICGRAGHFREALGTFHRKTPHASAGWAKADLFLKQYERWRALARQSSVMDCLQSILAETHYEAMLLAEPRGEERVANVHRLLELARHYDPYQRQGLYRFLQFIDAQQSEAVDHEPASSQSDDAVRLMTIHRSKGLEFPVVLLGGLATGFNFQNLRGDVLIQDRYGICPKIWPEGAVQNYQGLAHWMGTRAEQRELLGEEMRLLYVAVTRARDTLLLTGTSRKRATWESAPGSIVTDRELVSGRSYLDWLMKWLPSITASTDWKSENEGQNAFLRWKTYAAMNLPRQKSESASDSPLPAEVSTIPNLQRRLAWRYPNMAATQEPAVKRVSEVIWERSDSAEEQQLVMEYSAPGSELPSPALRRHAGELTAAQVGIAYHTFLQSLPMGGAQSVDELQKHAQRLLADRILTKEDVLALDLTAVERFWSSPVGQAIRQHADAVHREVPFTARFSPQDLASVGVSGNADELQGEFFVTRGAVDLAVLLPQEVWIVDFKTDRIETAAMADKVAVYGKQLRLYALALSRIYRRPVTKSWLHFFSIGASVEV